FRPSDYIYSLKTVICKQQGIWVCVADIFGGQNKQSSSNKGWVFPSFNHPCQPVYCGVRITSSDRFDKGGNNVVMLLTGFVVERHVLLNLFEHEFVINMMVAFRKSIANQFQYVK